VNAGASFGNVKTDFNVAPVTVTATTGETIPIPGFGFSDTEYPSGFMGGGQIGYNWQYSSLIVVGFEADFQGALERDSANLNNPFSETVTVFSAGGVPLGPNTVTGTTFTDLTAKIDWFGTVRLRAGYVWGNGNVMSYLTAGLAYGKVDLEGTSTVSGETFPPGGGVHIPFSIANNFSHNAVNTGWVVGYGTEGVIDFWGARNWTWKVEGLYMDLGHLDTTGVTSGASVGHFGSSVTGGQVTTHSHFTDGILRAGLNYKFY
jgi:outer membrane immunogenic protein